MDVSELAERYWEQLLETDPIIGLQTGDDRFADSLPDPSPTGVARRESVHRSALDDARRLAPMAATQTDRIVLDTIVAIARPELRSIELGLYRLAPIDQLWGPATLVDQLATLQNAQTVEQIQRYLGRLQAIPRFLDETATLLRDAGDLTAPALLVDRCIRQVEAIVDTRPHDSPLLRPLDTANTATRERLIPTVRDDVVPAYARYLSVLREYRARARESIGLSALPRGDEMYATLIERHTSLNLHAEEIHDTGVERLAAIQSERRELAGSLGARTPQQALAVRRDGKSASFSSRDEILAAARDQVERGWERSRDFFGRLPQTNCEVRPVHPSREADVLEHYFPAAPDGSRPAVYYVNTARADQRPRHSLATTTFHEASPGHHLQTSLDQAHDDRPDLLRFGGELAGAAFIEGWGLYAERLADEMRLFADLYERMGMLDLQAIRAARLVVDTGIHALGWPRERVVEMLRDAGLDQFRAELEADRYIAVPGQALAYMLGQLEIQRARQAEERRLGAAFLLSGFHDRVLAIGSCPLRSFRRELASDA